MKTIPQHHAEFVAQVRDALPFDPRPLRPSLRPRRRIMDRSNGPEPVVNIICAVVAAALMAAGIGCFLWLAIRHLP